MLDALISGTLHQAAQAAIGGASGRPYVKATIRVAVQDGPALFIKVVTFSDTVGQTLLELAEGDTVAVAGSLKPTAWTDRDGNARAGADVVAHQVMTIYGMRKRRAAVAAAGGAPAAGGAGQRDAPDDGPDPWLDDGER
jgi:single-stranded DNA-binding protein